MLFNRAINNTDDHERNFSLISEGYGYKLSPAYDLVPSLAVGGYPVAGYKLKPWAPIPTEAMKLGKIFGLPKTTVKRVVDQVVSAVEHWPLHAQSNDVSEVDCEKIKSIIKL